MIDYPTFHEIRRLRDQEHLSAAQIAAALNLDERTVSKWLDVEKYQPRKTGPRRSKLDPFKSAIVRLLSQHPYTAVQLLHRLKEAGYDGGYSILKAFVQQVRPAPTPAFLTLHFAPGQSAQVDWGDAGFVPVGHTRRRLSFFVMVLCYSRRLYVEFTLAQTQEHFLAAHQHAFEYFQGVVHEVIVDNCKTAILSHPIGQPAVPHPRYLDFARHYGFAIKACGPKKAHEKGRVEKAVHYVRQSFLAGLQLAGLEAINAAARRWLDEVANVRVHGETHQTPQELFASEHPSLQPLTVKPYEPAGLQTVLVSSRCRVTFDTNRYSVPPAYAGKTLVLKVYPDRLVLYHQDRVVAEHVRSYDRHQDFEKPEHIEALLAQRRQARTQQHLTRFLALSPRAREYYQGLAEKRGNALHHVQKIVALSEIYGAEKVARTLEDALAYHAFSCEYIANLLEQRERPAREPGALHLTRQQDLLELDLPAPDLSLYDAEEQGGAA
jgi:transposase